MYIKATNGGTRFLCNLLQSLEGHIFPLETTPPPSSLLTWLSSNVQLQARSQDLASEGAKKLVGQSPGPPARYGHVQLLQRNDNKIAIGAQYHYENVKGLNHNEFYLRAAQYLPPLARHGSWTGNLKIVWT